MPPNGCIRRPSLHSSQPGRRSRRNLATAIPGQRDRHLRRLHSLSHPAWQAPGSLGAADQSRARTLAQNLGVTSAKASFRRRRLTLAPLPASPGPPCCFTGSAPASLISGRSRRPKSRSFRCLLGPSLPPRPRLQPGLLDAEDPWNRPMPTAVNSITAGRSAARLIAQHPVMILADGELSHSI